MSSFLIEIWSTKKSYTAPNKEISQCSSFVKTFDRLLKQKLYLCYLIILNYT